MQISKVKAKDLKDGKVKTFSIATASQEQVNAAVNEYAEEHGFAISMNSSGIVHL